MESELLWLLSKVFAFLLFFVGGYVFMFLNVMRSDPKEIKFRKDNNIDNVLIPYRYK